MSVSLFAPRRSLASSSDPQAATAELASKPARDRASSRAGASAKVAADPAEAKQGKEAKEPREAKTTSKAPKSAAEPRRASSRGAASASATGAGAKDGGDSKGGAPKDTGDPKPIRCATREAAALLLLASALYTSLALASFRGDPLRIEVVGDDWVGPVGALIGGALVQAMGMCAWLVPVDLALFAGPLLQGRKAKVTLVRVAGDLVVLVVAAALLHVAFPQSTAFGAMPLGGSVGELFGEVMRALFSTLGSYIVGLTVVSLILIGRAAFSIIDWAQRAERRARALRDRGHGGLRAIVGAWDQARELDEKRREEERRAGEPVITEACDEAIVAALGDDSPMPFPKVKPLVPALAGDAGLMGFVGSLASPGALAGGAAASAGAMAGTMGNAARAARAEAPTPTPRARGGGACGGRCAHGEGQARQEEAGRGGGRRGSRRRARHRDGALDGGHRGGGEAGRERERRRFRGCGRRLRRGSRDRGPRRLAVAVRRG